MQNSSRSRQSLVLIDISRIPYREWSTHGRTRSCSCSRPVVQIGRSTVTVHALMRCVMHRLYGRRSAALHGRLYFVVPRTLGVRTPFRHPRIREVSLSNVHSICDMQLACCPNCTIAGLLLIEIVETSRFLSTPLCIRCP